MRRNPEDMELEKRPCIYKLVADWEKKKKEKQNRKSVFGTVCTSFEKIWGVTLTRLKPEDKEQAERAGQRGSRWRICLLTKTSHEEEKKQMNQE